jgi:hypothetical protein
LTALRLRFVPVTKPVEALTRQTTPASGFGAREQSERQADGK